MKQSPRAGPSPFDPRCRSLSASATRLVRHSAPLRLSMIARLYEVGLVDSWRADSLSRSMARSRNYPMLQNSLMARANSDSVALMRFAAEAGDDGAAQSRPRTAVLFVFS